MANKNVPVLVGVGQITSRWDGKAGPEGAPSYLSLASAAAQKAIQDSGGDQRLNAEIDTIAIVRTMADSVPSFSNVFGRCNNLPRGVANAIGANPTSAIYSSVGGQSPQSLVNEMATRIARGDSQVALIGGSEALGAMKSARRSSIELDWEANIDGEQEDRGLGAMMLNRSEIKHGMIAPAYFYALFETAYAHRVGHNRSDHLAAMSQLFAPFSKVASQNPFAQFRTARSAEFLSTVSGDNYHFADPYLKWHMAQDAVNMAAAVLMMSASKADDLGIDPARRVYLHGSGEAQDDFISERPVLDKSWAMQEALNRALDQSEKQVGDISLLDLYSCFPIAVFSSAEALGIDWKTDHRDLTLTGGLPFFGGPGNNYSLHGIASMVAALRKQPDAFGLVLANGGWMSKEAAGIYSCQPVLSHKETDPIAKPGDKVAYEAAPNDGTLETYTIAHDRNGPSHAIAFVRTKSGKRYIASSRDSSTLARLSGNDLLVGASVTAQSAAEVNTFQFV